MAAATAKPAAARPLALPELTIAPADRDGHARMRLLREQLTAADVERRLAGCVDTLLSNAELPVNPFPPLARLLRHEELTATLEPLPRPLSSVATACLSTVACSCWARAA